MIHSLTRAAPLAVLTALFSAGTGASVERAAARAALESITSSELQRHVDVLADDMFEGRAAGTRGGHAAGAYLATFLKEQDLDGGGDRGSFFQPFQGACRNVLGLIPGSDPILRHEVVLVGAHYDHVGYGSARNSFGPTGYIHNGADDNASGVAGLLELIDGFVKLGERPRRSILFAFWDGEEQGLLGSQHWVSHPTIELDRVVFAVNVDMIGRLRESKVEVCGSRTGFALRRLVSRANRDAALVVDFNWEIQANSDHYTFIMNRVPTVMFHTGLHGDYHRPSDDAHRIHAEGIRTVTRAIFDLVLDVADRDTVPAFRSDGIRETPEHRTWFERPAERPAPRFGISWAQSAPDGQLVVSELLSGGPAERAGLRIGDRLLTIDGERANDPRRFRQAVMAADRTMEVTLERGDSSLPLHYSVTLDGSPSRIGIVWRTDPADPTVFRITTVLAGSPAEDAGLQVGDWIYDVDGRPARSTAELVAAFQPPQSEFTVTVERDGQVREARLRLRPPGSEPKPE
ncbi:MAG: M20/M25/M40 family metallo-hydrolase [Planctomycetes bacterium]|nr:M20/M25/M40 family metallo-hydrolase [Planctomycetota bacterium]